MELSWCIVFCKNGRRRPILMSQNHFRSHFWPFQIDTELFFGKAGCHLDGMTMSIIKLVRDIWGRRPFWMSEITFDRISGHFRQIRNFFWQSRLPFGWDDNVNYRTRPRYLGPAAILDVRNHFRSHFWPFQIDTELGFLNFGQNV